MCGCAFFSLPFFASRTDSDGKWLVCCCTFGSLNDSRNINTGTDEETDNICALKEKSVLKMAQDVHQWPSVKSVGEPY